MKEKDNIFIGIDKLIDKFYKNKIWYNIWLSIIPIGLTILNIYLWSRIYYYRDINIDIVKSDQYLAIAFFEFIILVVPAWAAWFGLNHDGFVKKCATYKIKDEVNETISHILTAETERCCTFEEIIEDIYIINNKIKVLYGRIIVDQEMVTNKYLPTTQKYNAYLLLYSAVHAYLHPELDGVEYDRSKLICEEFKDEFLRETNPFLFAVEREMEKIDNQCYGFNNYSDEMRLYRMDVFMVLNKKEIEQMSYNLVKHYEESRKNYSDKLRYEYENIVNSTKLPEYLYGTHKEE